MTKEGHWGAKTKKNHLICGLVKSFGNQVYKTSSCEVSSSKEQTRIIPIYIYSSSHQSRFASPTKYRIRVVVNGAT